MGTSIFIAFSFFLVHYIPPFLPWFFGARCTFFIRLTVPEGQEMHSYLRRIINFSLTQINFLYFNYELTFHQILSISAHNASKALTRNSFKWYFFLRDSVPLQWSGPWKLKPTQHFKHSALPSVPAYLLILYELVFLKHWEVALFPVTLPAPN